MTGIKYRGIDTVLMLYITPDSTQSQTGEFSSVGLMYYVLGGSILCYGNSVQRNMPVIAIGDLNVDNSKLTNQW